jgi:3-hydroxyisobutyrate dehydrogenase-like beta-hydroxyacid dehydrogenase
MTRTVAVIAAGSMGAGVGARLASRGLRVLTSLSGRGAASADRARRAGMEPVADAALAEAEVFLSIVPPGTALALAERIAPVLGGQAIYVDCNAVSPTTVAGIAQVVTAAGRRFVDSGIIGGPPGADDAGPRFYVSGEAPEQIAWLGEYGLDIRRLDGPVGAASALKMSYGGITKGLTALASVMLLGALRGGAADALRQELAASQPELLRMFTRGIPAMYPKAYRWVAEMEEVAGFLQADPAGAAMLNGAAALYDRLAADVAESGPETRALAALLAGTGTTPDR